MEAHNTSRISLFSVAPELLLDPGQVAFRGSVVRIGRQQRLPNALGICQQVHLLIGVGQDSEAVRMRLCRQF